MDYIRMENNAILFENDGEVLRIEPWGKIPSGSGRQ